jgi:broad specificity phosphatase PhoE
MLVLVRHGRTLVNAQGRLLGRADPPLDELGAAQAVAVAAALGPVDRIVSSPLRRARETAAAFGTPVTIDERWIELDYGEFEGRPVDSLGVETWAAWRADVDFAPPAGESLRALGERVRAACEELLEVARDETVVVVSHVSPLKAALAWTLGVGDEVSWRCFVSPASVTRVALGPLGPSLRSFNETAHLDGLAG